MKQKPTVIIEAAAVEKALATTRVICPAASGDPSIEAILALVARETARNVVEGLTNEGYFRQSQPSDDPFDLTKLAAVLSKGKSSPELVAQGTDLAAKLITILASATKK